tara:strand:- start:374 stop:604 length:231 start_codon:yes stop_codon:yes gene_type:complete
MEDLEKRVDTIEKKLDKLIDLIETKVEPNTNKMSNHIDFIETVYDNIKNPLGFFIHKLSYFKGKEENHSLEDNKFN